MPQLDQFTYLTQFVWLCFFYMTFYVLLFNDGLPKISRILKLRAFLCAQRPQSSDSDGGAKQISEAKIDSLDSQDRRHGTIGVQTENQDVVFRTLNSSISYLNSSVNGAFNWCSKSVENLNANQLKPMNKTYLRSIGEISLSENIKNSALNASAPLGRAGRSAHRALFLELSQVWALRVQKCLLSGINKKKRKK